MSENLDWPRFAGDLIAELKRGNDALEQIAEALMCLKEDVEYIKRCVRLDVDADDEDNLYLKVKNA